MAVKKHRDLAWMILVGRSLDVLPWDLDTDRELINRERVLWASLTDQEREIEQKALRDLWKSKSAEGKRFIEVNPEWGEWTKGLDRVLIPNHAFGIPANDLRPFPKDGSTRYPFLANLGYRPPFGPEGGVVTIMVTVPRAVPETNRLLGHLARRYNVQPWSDSSEGVQLRSCYDPVTGLSVIEIKGLPPDG